MAAFICPHCNSDMYIRTSEKTSELTRGGYAVCKNVHCGHVGYIVSEMVRSVVPANFPNPKCHLPVIKPEDPRDPFRSKAQQELPL